MRRMLKYPLFDMQDATRASDTITVSAPTAVSSFIGIQGGVITLWAQVDDSLPDEHRTFIVVGTGHKIPVGYFYRSTVFDRQFVWHIFERQQ